MERARKGLIPSRCRRGRAVRIPVFCREYLKTGNGAEAARVAGYAPRRAKQTALELLNSPDVQSVLASLRERDETGSPRFAGVSIRLGRRDYVVPPLSLAQLKRFAGELSRLSELPHNGVVAPLPEQYDAVIELALAAIHRNYPEVTRAHLVEVVDLANFGPLIRAALGTVQPQSLGDPA